MRLLFGYFGKKRNNALQSVYVFIFFLTVYRADGGLLSSRIDYIINMTKVCKLFFAFIFKIAFDL